MTRRTRILLALATGLALLLPAGCVSLPQDGPVVQAGSTTTENDEPGVYIDPRPPVAGASATEIVKGFLDAMTATPVKTKVAREFLAQDATTSWNPEQETITYADASPPIGGDEVSVTLDGADRLDVRGAWQGPVSAADSNLRFPMVKEKGQWRIAKAPNALIVPETWFEQRFRQVSLYFFDPTAQILVPEPVFVPRGEQLASTLINALLRGPGPGLDQVSRSFLPSGLSVGLSVPVSVDGVADVSLTGDAGQQTAQAAQLMLAQLAWTLRQERSIDAVRLTIDGQEIQLPGGSSEVGVDEAAQFDPSGYRASPLLYGLRDGLMVSGTAESLEATDGPLGEKAYGIRSISADLTATSVAGVSATGRSVLVGPGRGRTGGVQEVVSGATDLLRPAWDFAGRLWLVDRAPDGARVSYVVDDKPRSVVVPGISGTKVASFVVSRDASRLVAVVRRPSGDVLMVSRLRYDGQGRFLGATRAERISWDGDARLRVRDIGWRSPSSLVVLHRLTGELTQVRTVSVDGAPAGLGSLSTTLRGRVLALASSPVPGETLYAVSGSSLVDLSSAVTGNIPLEGVDQVGYAG